MKIVLATPLFPPEVGGPATYTVDLAQRLTESHEVVIVAYADKAEPISGVSFVAVSKKQFLPLRLLSYFFALYRNAKHADLIYVQNAVAAGLPAALVGMLLKKPVILKFVGDEAWERATQSHKTKRDVETFLRSPEGGWRTKIFMAIQGFVLRHVSIVTTPSRYLSELLIAHYGVKKERAVVNYNAVEIPIIPRASRAPYQLMTAVRLVTWKGVDGVIEAVAKLKEKFPTIKLVVAGEGPEKARLEVLTLSLGVEKNVSFVGRLSKPETLRLQSESTLQVLNSRYEGLPHGVLESFATKTPVVATNISGTNEAIEDGVSGLLVPTEDPQALAEAIDQVLSDASLRERLVEGGAQKLQEKFSWDAHMREFFNMCEKAKAV